MATLRAFRALDMRFIVREDSEAEAVGSGTLLGFSQTHAGAPVFEAIRVERSAPTVLSILEDRDNDRFLAYTLSSDDLIFGSGNGDYLIGFGGGDTLRGRGGDDRLFGGIGHDTIEGGTATITSPAAAMPTG